LLQNAWLGVLRGKKKERKRKRQIAIENNETSLVSPKRLMIDEPILPGQIANRIRLSGITILIQ